MIAKFCMVLVMMVWAIAQVFILGPKEIESLIVFHIWMVGAILLAWMPTIK